MQPVNILSDIATSSNKIAATVVGASTGTGLAQMLDLVPDNIGKLSAVIGAVLAAALLIKVIIEIVILSRKFGQGEPSDDD